MKFKLSIIAILASLSLLSQITTLTLNDIAFTKVNDGFLVYGNSGDNYTLTKYNNQVVKIKEYSKNLKGIKRKNPSFKIFPNYIQLVFYTKIFPAKGIVTRLDTNLNVIDEREFGPEAFENLNKSGASLGDSFYTPYGFEDERTQFGHYTYYSDMIVIFDRQNKKLVFGKRNNSDIVPFYDRRQISDIQCEGEIDAGSCGFTHLNNRLFFFIKTKTDEIKTKMNAFGGRRSASLGELIIGEIDTKRNSIKYTAKISNLNLEYDFSLDKLFYDSSADKLIVAGTYLDNTSFENSKEKLGSEWTGWYVVKVDGTGKTESHNIIKNDDRIFENIKERTQSNRRTSVKSIERSEYGYIFTTELAAKINFNSETGIPGMSNSILTFQPFGFCKFNMDQKLEVKKSEFYPAKVWHKIKFEEVENSNIVRPGECRPQAYCISSTQQSAIIYTFGKNIISCKEGKEYAFVQELLSADVEVRAQDMSAISRNTALLNMVNENIYLNPNTTWFYPFDDKKYYLLQWKQKELVFNLLSY